MVEGTKRLLRAGAEVGARHYVGVSIVGCERVPMAYYKVKVEQEKAIAAGAIPWSLLCATQFHTLIACLFKQDARFADASGLAAPASSRSTRRWSAKRMAVAAHADPAGRLPDIAGPEVLTLSELAGAWRRVGRPPGCCRCGSR